MFQDYKIAYFRERVAIKETRELSFIRQSVGHMLSQSARSIPHAGGVTSFDVTPMVEYARESVKTMQPRENEAPEQFRLRKAVRKNFSAFYLKALAHTLFHCPTLNSVLDYRVWRNRGRLYVAEDINVGYTIHTKFGVIKPVLRNAHTKDLVSVADEMRKTTRRARKTDANELYHRAALLYLKKSLKELNFTDLGGVWMLLRSLLWKRTPADPEFRDVPEEEKLQPEEILGVTATLANIGMSVHGNQTVTVITPPEVLMCGIGDVHEEARVINGCVVPRHVVAFFATFDHRAFDAGELFPLVQRMQGYFNNPEKIYEWQPGAEI